MVDFLQAALGGLGAGSLYALMALGLVLIYRATHVVNFGQADLVTMVAFVAFLLAQLLPLGLALALAILLGGFLGIAVDRAVMAPARRRGASPLALLVASLGVGILVNGLNGLFFGHSPRSLPSPWPSGAWLLGAVVVSWDVVLNVLTAALLAAALFLWFRYSLLGLGVRAVLENPWQARLCGVPAPRVYGVSWALGVGLGGVAGLLAAPLVYLEPNALVELLVKGFAAAVLGGLTSLPGAVVGGLGLGLVENWVALYLGPELKSTVAFLVIVGVLALRPAGLLGEAPRIRV
ncbi:branched-chain amino acid ABC transporter permease [Thermus sp. FJN-A]